MYQITRHIESIENYTHTSGGRPAWPTARGLRSCHLDVRGFESHPPHFILHYLKIVYICHLMLSHMEFFKGLLTGFVGLVIWVVTSTIEGINQGFGGEENSTRMAIVTISYFIMIGGPLYYWILINFRKKKD